jgi:hypothetical protein
MHRYAAFGLRIDSEFALPGLPAHAEGDADVVIHEGTVEPPSRPTRIPNYVGGADVGCLSWEPAGSARISRGSDVVVAPRADAGEGSVSAFLVGPVLGIVLTQRGLMALHASAVELAGQALAFLGTTGAGKSTVAGMLHRGGHAVLADDITAVRLDGDRALVVPGFPQLKLWPETITGLGEDPDSLERVVAAAEKRRRPAANGFSPGERRLAGIYLLTDGERPRTEAVRPSEALIELVRNSWGARSLHHAEPARLGRFAELAETVPVRRLYRPKDLTAGEALTVFLEREVAGR